MRAPARESEFCACSITRPGYFAKVATVLVSAPVSSIAGSSGFPSTLTCHELLQEPEK